MIKLYEIDDLTTDDVADLEMLFNLRHVSDKDIGKNIRKYANYALLKVIGNLGYELSAYVDTGKLACRIKFIGIEVNDNELIQLNSIFKRMVGPKRRSKVYKVPGSRYTSIAFKIWF